MLLPVTEPDLTLGPLFSQQQQTVAFSLRHPFAARASLTADEVATTPLITASAPAPRPLARGARAFSRTRKDVVFVPVDGLPDSVLGMVWHRDGETERVRAFARAVSDAAPE